MGVVFPNLFSFVHAPPVRDGDEDDNDGVHRDASNRPGVDDEWARVPVSVRADDVSACFKCVKALFQPTSSC